MGGDALYLSGLVEAQTKRLNGKASEFRYLLPQEVEQNQSPLDPI
jgi:hypothetical protein